MLSLANWQRGGKGPKPKPLDRPGEKKVLGKFGRPKAELAGLVKRFTGRDL